jgi:asparagine synthase (glutamine-hydrolysing)
LSGTGGDELFAGYNGFTRWKSYRRFARFLKLPLFRPLAAGICQMSSAKNFRKLTELLSYRDQGLKAFYESSRSIYSDLELKQLIDLPEQAATSIVELDSEIIRKYPALSQYSIAELSQYTMEVLLKDTDQMSMSHALEVREPFFDHRLIEYVLRVSDKDKFSEKTPKSLFVEAMKDLIPSEIIYRPKKGFTFPWNHWLRGELSEFCNTSIEALERRSILKAGQAKTLWEQFLKNSNKVSWLQIWLLVILENWLQRVLDDKH